MRHFWAQIQLVVALQLSTFLKIVSLDFSEIVPDDRHLQAEKSDGFGFSVKILTISKIQCIGHFWAPIQLFNFSQNLFNRFFYLMASIKKLVQLIDCYGFVRKIYNYVQN